MTIMLLREKKLELTINNVKLEMVRSGKKRRDKMKKMQK